MIKGIRLHDEISCKQLDFCTRFQNLLKLSIRLPPSIDKPLAASLEKIALLENLKDLSIKLAYTYMHFNEQKEKTGEPLMYIFSIISECKTLLKFKLDSGNSLFVSSQLIKFGAFLSKCKTLQIIGLKFLDSNFSILDLREFINWLSNLPNL